jgi:hypothetical protein
MTYNIITANIVRHVARHGGVLVHQVNCQQVAGRGLAGEIRYQWPAWFDHYSHKPAHFDHIDVFHVNYPTLPSVTIVSLYAQNWYGTHERQTDYEAFTITLVRFRYHIARTGEDPQSWADNHGGIYMPMGIGCGLAGGDWKVIEPILVREMPANFTLCKLPT